MVSLRNRSKCKIIMMAKEAMVIKEVKSGTIHKQTWPANSALLNRRHQTYIEQYIKTEAAAAGKMSISLTKNFSQGSHPKLGESLHMWLTTIVASRIPMSGDLVKQEIENLAL